MMLLYETPSGFAIISLGGVDLDIPVEVLVSFSALVSSYSEFKITYNQVFFLQDVWAYPPKVLPFSILLIFVMSPAYCQL
jgi:hypothetical protein